jgi:5-methylcytosine-specific restriction endonuclease McrA
MTQIQKPKTFVYLVIGLEEKIANDYKLGEMTTDAIAKKYNISTKTVQRVAKKLGVLRTLSESNKLISKLKDYSGHRVAVHLRKKRKTLSPKLRYEMITEHPYCSTCGNTISEARLEIDHIDENPSNNDRSNLQVLCMFCNRGKSHNHRYPQIDATQ